MGFGVAQAFGWGLGGGVVFGLSLSVASTVVLLRAMEARGDLGSPESRIAVGWLIVEDIFMILALLLLPTLAATLGVRPSVYAGGTLLTVIALTVVTVAA